MTTQQIIDKASAGVDLEQGDLDVLKTMIELSEGAPEPEPEDKVIDPGKVLPAPMVRTKSISAGYVWLRRNSDGNLRQVNKNLLSTYLKQKLEDGRPAWLAPKVAWHGKKRVGTERCWLHAEHKMRPIADVLGLPLCRKANLLGSSVRLHMRKKHKDAFEAFQRYEDEQKEERRSLRDERMSDALTAALGGAKKPEAAAPEPGAIVCDVCSASFDGKTLAKAKANMRAHRYRVHGPKAEKEQ